MAKPFDLEQILAPVADIVRRLNDRRQHLLAEVEMIESEVARLGGGRSDSQSNNVHTPRIAGGRRKRIRRSRAEVEAEAKQVVEFIRSAGKAGLSGREIKTKFKIGAPSLNGYLRQ